MNGMIHSLNAVSAAWAPWIWGATWRLFVVGAGAWFLSWLMRRHSARFLYWIWFITIVQVFLPPRWPVKLPLREPVTVSFPAVLPLPQSVEAVPAEEHLSIWSVLFLSWLIVVVILAAKVALENFRFKSRLKFARDFQPRLPGDGDAEDLTGLRVKLLPWKTVPFCWGLFHPTVFLPREAANWSPQDLKTVLAHEQSHIRRGDLWLSLPVLIAQILFFFHPVVWLASARLELFRETACDEAVIEETRVEPAAYGRLLLQQLRESLGVLPGRVFVQGLNFQRRIHYHRFRYLLERKEDAMRGKSFTGGLALFLAVVLAVSLPMLQCSKKEPVKPQEVSSSVKTAPPVLAKQADYETPPKPKGGISALNKKIMFSEKYKAAEYRGTILASIQIDETGKVKKVDLRQQEGEKLPEGLLQEIKQSIENTEWTPAMKDGKPVAATVFVPIMMGAKPSSSKSASRKLSRLGQELEFVPFNEPPEPIGGFAAIQRNLVYPEAARRAGIEGTVILHVLIDENGNVADTWVLKSLGNSDCDEAAVAAIKKTKWKPAMQNGKPVKVRISVPVIFRLRKAQQQSEGEL